MDKIIDAGKKVILGLKNAGFEAYFVGGFVRDYLIGKKANDIDITTNALPDDVMAIFQAIPTGLKYGTVTVKMDGYCFEVTTYRCDLNYVDNRHPEVLFTKSLEDDLARRDFTINALVMDEDMNIGDNWDGRADLENKVIKAIGDPTKRFNEDALRILRAIYFVSKLGFTIDDDTAISMEKCAHLLKNISIERIYNELKKIFDGAYQTYAVLLMVDLGLIDYLPGLGLGLKFISVKKTPVTLDEMFVLSFKLNEEVSDSWHFSSNDESKYSKAMELAMVAEDGNYNPLIVYSYGLDICLLANRVNVLLGYPDASEGILSTYQRLPIHKTCDLVFKGQDIMNLTDKRAASWLGDLVDEIKFKVINKELRNNYDEIKQFVVECLKKEDCYKE